MLCTLDKDPHIESFFGQCLRPCEGCAHRPTEYYDDIGVTWTVCLRWYNLLHPVQSLQHWVFLYVDASVYHYPCASCSVCYAGSKTLFFCLFVCLFVSLRNMGKGARFGNRATSRQKFTFFLVNLPTSPNFKPIRSTLCICRAQKKEVFHALQLPRC